MGRTQGFVEKRKKGRRDWTKGQRKRGVKREENRSKPKKSTKILLTGKCHSHDSRIAPVSCLPPENVPTFLSYPHAGKKRQQGAPVSAQLNKDEMTTLEMDREVIRCKTCGLVQYRTRTGNCRRCVRALPQRLEFMIPPPPPAEEAADEPVSEKLVNQQTVENIGQRIRQLRESRSMTQSQLQSRSKVSRSYLSRIESGQITPSLGTLEKISEALNVGLNRFFIPESDGEALLEDPFIQGLRPFLRQLDWEQWQSILKRLQAISDHLQAAPANGHLAGHIGTGHSNGAAHAHLHPQGYAVRPSGPFGAASKPAFLRTLAR